MALRQPATKPQAGVPAEHGPALERLERIAEWMDGRFRVPGTNFRFGLDGLIGLVPGVGDGASGLIACYIVLEAWRHGAPKGLILRMLGNVGIDTLVGAVPVLGDVFDFAFKANRRNINLLRRHLGSSPTQP